MQDEDDDNNKSSEGVLIFLAIILGLALLVVFALTIFTLISGIK